MGSNGSDFNAGLNFGVELQFGGSRRHRKATASVEFTGTMPAQNGAPATSAAVRYSHDLARREAAVQTNLSIHTGEPIPSRQAQVTVNGQFRDGSLRSASITTQAHAQLDAANRVEASAQFTRREADPYWIRQAEARWNGNQPGVWSGQATAQMTQDGLLPAQYHIAGAAGTVPSAPGMPVVRGEGQVAWGGEQATPRLTGGIRAANPQPVPGGQSARPGQPNWNVGVAAVAQPGQPAEVGTNGTFSGMTANGIQTTGSAEMVYSATGLDHFRADIRAKDTLADPRRNIGTWGGQVQHNPTDGTRVRMEGNLQNLPRLPERLAEAPAGVRTAPASGSIRR